MENVRTNRLPRIITVLSTPSLLHLHRRLPLASLLYIFGSSSLVTISSSTKFHSSLSQTVRLMGAALNIDIEVIKPSTEFLLHSDTLSLSVGVQRADVLM